MRRAKGEQVIAQPGLPLQAEHLTGPRPAEDADTKQTEIVRVRHGRSQRHNLLCRECGLFNRLGIGHHQVFSGILGNELELAGCLENRFEVDVGVPDNRIRVRLRQGTVIGNQWFTGDVAAL